jgi:hypothetical protein
MLCGKENLCTEGLLAEWGVKPLLWLHQPAIEYFFRVQLCMPLGCLSRCFVQSGSARGRCVADGVAEVFCTASSLQCKYGVDVSVASGPAGECNRHIRRQVALLCGDMVATAACKKSTFSSCIV